MKTCTKCGEPKPLDEFPRKSTAGEDRRNICKRCEAERWQRYRAANKETLRQQWREYRAANSERRAAYARQWREANAEHRLAYRRANAARALAWYEANKQRERERYREWYRENRELVLAKNREIREAVLDHYGRRCACCGSTEELQIDHVNGGGTAHRESLGLKGAGSNFHRWLVKQGFPGGFQTLCRPCNRSKFDGERCRLDHGGQQWPAA